jgi:murein DD-endopeptidase MepM/ murein hydrolase activator NlpD
MTVRVFPVDLATRPNFANTWGAPRPGNRLHQGTDIFAPEGTEVYAVDVGRVEFQTGSIGGNVAVLHSDDTTRYIYAHLSAFEGQAPRRVIPGTLIGRVGHTGNAAHTLPHLHFEIHPVEGAAINPFPALVQARDATLHPDALPEPEPAPPPAAPSSPSSSSSSFPAIDGAAVLFLLLIGLQATRGGRRWRWN